MNKIIVTIIICTRDRAEYLEQTLKSIAAIYVPDELPTELLVIDNASIDNTKAVVGACDIRSMSVRYIYESLPGKCHALTTGTAESRGDIILFTDDDVRLPRDWIAGMCKPILAGSSEAVAGGITMAPHLKRSWMKEVHRNWLVEHDFSRIEHPHVLIGANMAIARIVAETVKWNVELGPGAMGFSDDVLFSWQVEQAGFPIVSAGDVCVEHHFDPSRLSRASLLNRARQEGRATAYLAINYLNSELRFSRLRMAKHQLMLALWRVLHQKQCAQQEGCAESELLLLKEVFFHKHYIVERHCRRN